MIYLYRLNNYRNYSIQIIDSSIQTQLGELYSFLSKKIPLTTDLTHDLTFFEATKKNTENLFQLKNNQTFFKDIFVRYPEIKSPKNEILIRIVDKKESIAYIDDQYKLIISIFKDEKGLDIDNNTNYKDNEATCAYLNRIEEH